MIGGIVPAAGMSKRMGKWKPGLKLEGKYLIQRTLEPLLEVADSVVVVGGYRFQDLLNIFKETVGTPETVRQDSGWPFYRIKKGAWTLILCFNPDYETTDMFRSIQIAAHFLPQRVESFFIVPGDYPFIRTDTYRKMLAVKSDIVVPSFNRRKGHPVLLDGRLLESLKNFSGGNLRDFTKKFKIEVVEVDDPGILRDTDRPEDIEWQKSQSR